LLENLAAIEALEIIEEYATEYPRQHVYLVEI
jgi:hypothetical protein